MLANHLIFKSKLLSVSEKHLNILKVFILKKEDENLFYVRSIYYFKFITLVEVTFVQ